MNSLIEMIIVAVIVAAAAAYVAVKAIGAARGKRPSCCGDGEESPKVKPPCCDGCSGCGS